MDTILAKDFLVRVQEISKSYADVIALHKVSFDISPGEKILLAGANGSGKSTLLACLAGIARPDFGQIIFSDNQSAPKNGSIGFLSQESFLYGHLTLKENLDFFSALHGFSEWPKSLAENEAKLRLSDFLERRTSECSPGVVRRVALVRAFAFDPILVLLDEPASGLDPEAQAVCETLCEKHLQDGKAIVIATHDVHQLKEHRGRTLIMESGICRDSYV